MKGKYPYWFSATINTEDIWRALVAWKKRTGGNFYDKILVTETRISRFKWVEDICFDHQCWIRVDFETSKPEIAKKRADETVRKLESLRKEIAEGKRGAS